MNYKIQITKCEPNPNLEKDIENMNQWSKNQMKLYNYDNTLQPPMAMRDIVSDVLICELTEEQYIKIKAEVVKVF